MQLRFSSLGQLISLKVRVQLLTSASSLVCATAPSSDALIVGRAIAGMGVGGLFSGAVVILAYCCKLIVLFDRFVLFLFQIQDLHYRLIQRT